jgi:hypothetical protein
MEAGALPLERTGHPAHTPEDHKVVHILWWDERFAVGSIVRPQDEASYIAEQAFDQELLLEAH